MLPPQHPSSVHLEDICTELANHTVTQQKLVLLFMPSRTNCHCISSTNAYSLTEASDGVHYAWGYRSQLRALLFQKQLS